MHFALFQPTKTLIGFTALLILRLLASSALGQGCMATRVSPPLIGPSGSARYMVEGETETSFAFRYYQAHRHFHDYNDENVPANAPRVKRSIYDASITRMLSSQTSATLSVPFQTGTFDRSPIPPYTGSADKASGLGDIALTFRRWMLETATHTKYNLRLGLGIKFPTGKNDVQTNRLVNVAPAGSPAMLAWRRGPADIAIQPGDGGLGVILNTEGFYDLGNTSLLYGELTYLANPRGHTEVNNQWSGPGPYIPNRFTSVPDYFLSRAGFALAEPFAWQRVSFQLGLRIEGQPVRDLVGPSDGFRRPGYTLAVEPGVAYGYKKWSAFVTVPITVYRVRWRSVDEKNAGRSYAVSAAFADYNILTGISRRW